MGLSSFRFGWKRVQGDSAFNIMSMEFDKEAYCPHFYFDFILHSWSYYKVNKYWIWL